MSHSINLSHLYPMPKEKKNENLKFQNLDGKHGHKLIKLFHLQMGKMRLKEGCVLTSISMNRARMERPVS